MRLYQLSCDSLHFPDPINALDEPNGLLAIGGDLSVARLTAAYRQGIFPGIPRRTYFMVVTRSASGTVPGHLSYQPQHEKFLRKHDFQVTLNHAFNDVIAACADEHDGGTWISQEITLAYAQLHQSGQAHSVEVWQNGSLVGGLYGVSQGGLFCGESMFSRTDNASKYALLTFQQHFIGHGGYLIDCQVLNAHTASLGVGEIPRDRFLQFLFQLRDKPLSDGCWRPQTLARPRP